VQKSSGDDVVDVSERVGRVEVDDEVGGVGEVEARAAAWTDRRHVDAARSLAGQKVPEDERPVLRHGHQLVGRRTEHHVADHLDRPDTAQLSTSTAPQATVVGVRDGHGLGWVGSRFVGRRLLHCGYSTQYSHLFVMDACLLLLFGSKL